MSNTVSLNASNASPQSVVATASATDNGQAISPQFAWETSDNTVATIQPLSNTTAQVTGVPDPSGSGIKIATITATCTVNGVTYSGTGTVSVTTIGDTVVVTVDFGTPTGGDAG